MNLVLVDTSVFVDFLRGKESARWPLEELLFQSRVVLSDLVRLELLMGLRIREQKALDDLLHALHPISLSEELMSRSIILLPLIRRSGLSVGIVDYLIVLQAMNNNCALLSYDKLMLKLAKLVGVKLA